MHLFLCYSQCGDRERNSPSAAHAGRQRRLKCVQGASGYSRATLPRALQIRLNGHQVGGWARGRQSVTVKKKDLTVRKPEMWLRNRQIKRYRHGQWTAAWNLRTFCTAYEYSKEKVSQVFNYNPH